MEDEEILQLFEGDLESLRHFKMLRQKYREKHTNSGNICPEEDFISDNCVVDVNIDRDLCEDNLIENNAYCIEDIDSMDSGMNLPDRSHSVNEISPHVFATVLRPIDDVLYLDGDFYGYRSKQSVLDECGGQGSEVTEDVDCMEAEDSGLFECGQQGCSKKFSALSEYESHYHSSHHYVCASCRRVLVSSLMLDVHIQENHDSYFKILCSRIDMYQCLVESCGLKFRTSELRKDHLVQVHKYPANFSFHKPINEKKLAEEKAGMGGEPMDCREEKNKEPVKRIPFNVCFGRGQQRSFQRRPRQKQRLNVEKLT